MGRHHEAQHQLQRVVYEAVVKTWTQALCVPISAHRSVDPLQRALFARMVNYHFRYFSSLTNSKAGKNQ